MGPAVTTMCAFLLYRYTPTFVRSTPRGQRNRKKLLCLLQSPRVYIDEPGKVHTGFSGFGGYRDRSSYRDTKAKQRRAHKQTTTCMSFSFISTEGILNGLPPKQPSPPHILLMSKCVNTTVSMHIHIYIYIYIYIYIGLIFDTQRSNLPIEPGAPPRVLTPVHPPDRPHTAHPTLRVPSVRSTPHRPPARSTLCLSPPPPPTTRKTVY
jgi:hypothetical protein